MKVLGRLVRAFVAAIAWGLHCGRHSYCPVENCEKQRLDCDSMLVEPKMRDGAEGIFGAGSAARVPNTGPSAYIPNKQFLVRVQRSSYVL
jgi:hypothetical protein